MRRRRSMTPMISALALSIHPSNLPSFESLPSILKSVLLVAAGRAQGIVIAYLAGRDFP